MNREFPSRLFVGRAYRLLPDLLPKGRVVVITDANIDRLYPDLVRGYEHIIIGGGEASKSLHTVEDIYRKLMEMGADRSTFILGIGGGSVLDAAKAVAIYASNPDLAPIDIYKREYNNPPLPVALIGTTAGTGSEVTAVAVLTNDETGIKKSISGPDCYAKISFCDPKYTATMPYKTTVSHQYDLWP